MPAFDPAKIRKDFPILSRKVEGRPLTYLDNGATSQKPLQVIERLSEFFRDENANIHRGVHYLSRHATDAYEQSREVISEALALPSTHELIFVRGTTEGINLIAHGLESEINPGDEIVLTLMEHHANFVPWQILAEKTGAVLKYVGVQQNGELELCTWKNEVSEKTKIAAFTHVSNVLGTVNPVVEMTAHAKKMGAWTVVDGAQALPHGPVSIAELHCDFYVFSSHKAYGPDGIGGMVGPKELLNAMPPYQSGGDMIELVSVEGTTFREVPERFEAGTPHISGAIGMAEAFRYMGDLDWIAIKKHEEDLLRYTQEKLAKIDGVQFICEAQEKVGVLSFIMENAHPHDIGTILDSEGVAIRAGHHCAQPLMTHLGLTATARASFALYNNEEDADALIRALEKVARYFA